MPMKLLALTEVTTFISQQQLSPQAQFIRLMKLSLREIAQYETAMKKQYNNVLPAEIIAEINTNLRHHQEEFGKEGSIRKMFFK